MNDTVLTLTGFIFTPFSFNPSRIGIKQANKCTGNLNKAETHGHKY